MQVGLARDSIGRPPEPRRSLSRRRAEPRSRGLSSARVAHPARQKTALAAAARSASLWARLATHPARRAQAPRSCGVGLSRVRLGAGGATLLASTAIASTVEILPAPQAGGLSTLARRSPRTKVSSQSFATRSQLHFPVGRRTIERLLAALDPGRLCQDQWPRGGRRRKDPAHPQRTSSRCASPAHGKLMGAAIQPDRGNALDPQGELDHDPDLPPRHAYAALLSLAA